MTVLVGVETALLLLLGLLVVGLLRSHAEILRSLEELGAGRAREADRTVGPAGTREVRIGSAPGDAADLAGVTPAGDATGIAVAGVGHDTVLVFLSAGCVTCAGFWAALRAPGGAGAPGGVRVVAVTKGPAHESPTAVADLAPRDVPVVMTSEAWDDYGVPGSPYVVHVSGPSGRVVGEGTADTWAHVLTMLGRAGLEGTGGEGTGGVESRARGGRDRAERIDAELLAAGITPGHPSLGTLPDVTGGRS